MADSDYQIVVASADDIKWILKMANIEGHNIGCNDAVAYHQADPTGFFVGLLNGQPVSCASGVKYQNFAFGGLYVVAKEHRGKGYGVKIFHYVLDSVKDYTFGIDSVIEQQSNYEMAGFKFAHKNTRYSGVISKSEATCHNIVEAKSISFAKLMEYDTRHFPGVRKYFLSSWINVATDRSVVYLDADKKIQGFAAIRKSYDGYKVGPLFAERVEFAEALLHALVDSLGECIKVIIDIPNPNNNAKKLIDKYNLEFNLETARMYLGPRGARWEIPDIDLDTVYGLTSLELG